MGLDCEMCATRDDDRELLGLCLIDADGEVLVQVREPLDSPAVWLTSPAFVWVPGRSGSRACEGLQGSDPAPHSRCDYASRLALAGAFFAVAYCHPACYAASTASV